MKKLNSINSKSDLDNQNILDPLSIFVLEQNHSRASPQTTAASSTEQISIFTNTLQNDNNDSIKLKTIQIDNVKSKLLSNNRNSITNNDSSKSINSNIGLQNTNEKSNMIFKEEKVVNATDENIHFLTGEHRALSILDSLLQIPTGDFITGILFMTNYRLLFLPSPADLINISLQNLSIHSYLNIPLACIDRIDRDKRSKEYLSTNSQINIVIICKDFRQYKVTIRSNSSKPGSGEYDIERALSVITAYAFPNNMRYLFAFTHKFSTLPANYESVPYIPALEFSRLGVIDSPTWRISAANNNFKLCNTYPQWLVVPSTISDDELHLVAGFRSGHRLPVLSWAHKENAATLWRSSQPKAGVSGTCQSDEKMLDAISRSCMRHSSASSVVSASPTKSPNRLNSPLIHIIDCRSRASAMANRAAGAGYESQTSYPTSKIEFYGIGNIHAVRDAYKSIATLLISGNSSSSLDLNFTKQVEDTQWLANIRAILKASYDSAMYLNNGIPVLVHCSHGWDRTAQVCSIAQLFLDPFYRTFEGFQALIEKEWISFGHPFQMRCGHSQDKQSRHDEEMSPIFLQFLDCVWQVFKQAPHYFEFNARYILLITEHIYSARFGTFLFSSDHDRELYKSTQLCPTIWTYLIHNKAILSNPLYNQHDQYHSNHSIWLPPLPQLLRNVSLWNDFFLRFSTVPSVPSIPFSLSLQLFRDGMCIPSLESEINYTSSSSSSNNLNSIQNNSSSNKDKTIINSNNNNNNNTTTTTNHSNEFNSHYDFEIGVLVTNTDQWEAKWRKEKLILSESEYKYKQIITHKDQTIDALYKIIQESNPEFSFDDIKDKIITTAISSKLKEKQENIELLSNHPSNDNINNYTNNDIQKSTNNNDHNQIDYSIDDMSSILV